MLLSSPFRLLAPLLVLALFLTAACGGSDDEDEPAVHTAANGDEFNDADVAFATEMIQHHAQALSMVDLTLGRELDPALVALAEQVRAAQGPEIELLTDWLVAWDEEVPETVRDHANAHGDSHAEPGDVPGMMSGEEMAELEAARGDAFRTLWLEMMIEHHEGAIAMAQDERDEGHHAGAVELATTIIQAQSAEIETMESMLH